MRADITWRLLRLDNHTLGFIVEVWGPFGHLLMAFIDGEVLPLEARVTVRAPLGAAVLTAFRLTFNI
jgi:hypothetical protein